MHKFIVELNDEEVEALREKVVSMNPDGWDLSTDEGLKEWCQNAVHLVLFSVVSYKEGDPDFLEILQ
jgi:hypothetical protein